MKKLSKVLAILFALSMILTMAACNTSKPLEPVTPSQGETPERPTEVRQLNIGILKWVTHGALDSSEQGFVDALKDNGFVDGSNIVIDRQNANDDASIAATISDRFVNNNSDLILAIATPAVQSIQGKTSTIPVLGTAVTDYVGANLVSSNEVPGGNISGTSDLTPIVDQFDLLLKVLPNIKTVGILYNSSEDNSQIQAQMATVAAEARGISVVTKTFSTVNDIPQTAESLAKEVEAFWIPTDNTLASAMSVLSAKATEMNIPIVCGEENMVVEGGTFTIGIDYYQLGYQTGEMAVRILRDGATPASMPIEYQNKMAIAVNKAAADAIGLVFPADILENAKDLSAAG